MLEKNHRLKGVLLKLLAKKWRYLNINILLDLLKYRKSRKYGEFKRKKSDIPHPDI